MAVSRIGWDKEYNLSEYMGLSTDTKPTNCQPGSTFLEIDLGRLFIFDGTNWIEL